jgi:hypothetical protein
MDRRLFRRLMRNHGRALATLLSKDGAVGSAQRGVAQKYLDDYPVERIIQLAWAAAGKSAPAEGRRP